VFLWRMFSE